MLSLSGQPLQHWIKKIPRYGLFGFEPGSAGNNLSALATDIVEISIPAIAVSHGLHDVKLGLVVGELTSILGHLSRMWIVPETRIAISNELKSLFKKQKLIK
jgi:hypothetical protein